MNYNTICMVVYMIDYIYIVKHDRMNYDTMKIIKDINR